MPYCTDARMGLLAFQGPRADAYAAMSSAAREAALEAASRVLDGYLRAVLLDSQLPLTEVGADVEQWTAKYAAHELLQAHGYDQPAEGNSDKDEHAMLIRRAKDIAAGLQHLSVSNAPITSDSPRVRSKTKRGWTDFE